MQQERLFRNPVFLVILVLLLPALLIHLDMMGMIDDEGIRSTVAFEMWHSGNYISPTLHDDFYYKKPPLFNWMIIAMYQLTGNWEEWTARLTNVVSLLLYIATIFYFFKKHFDKKFALLVALATLTCGRILFWDAFLGLIDITFSWVIFTLFMVVYDRFQEKKYLQLFLQAYALAAIAFLLKGLPAVVFVGITLLTIFIYKKEFRRFFSWQHIVGGLLFFVIIGSYYFAYYQLNGLDTLLSTLVSESTKRTVIHFGWWQTILHLFTFPFEMTYHFVPWSLGVILLFSVKHLQKLFQHDFLFYCVIIFLTNVIIYWTSPEVFPRYLLMFLPLVFAPFLWLWQEHQKESTLHFKIVNTLLKIWCLLILVGSFLPHFLPQSQAIEYHHLKAIFLTTLALPLVFLFFKNKNEKLLVVVAISLVARIGFNWFVLPDRLIHDPKTQLRANFETLGAAYQDGEIFIYKDSYVRPAVSFYLSKGAQKIVPRKYENFDKKDVFIFDVNKYHLEKSQVKMVDTLNYFQPGVPIWLAKMKEEE